MLGKHKLTDKSCVSFVWEKVIQQGSAGMQDVDDVENVITNPYVQDLVPKTIQIVGKDRIQGETLETGAGTVKILTILVNETLKDVEATTLESVKILDVIILAPESVITVMIVILVTDIAEEVVLLETTVDETLTTDKEGLDPMREQSVGFPPNGRRVEFSRVNVVTNCANRLIIGKLPVYTNDHADEGYYVQVMFDTGSDSSFIERDLAKKMRLQERGDGVNVRTTGFGGNKKYQECENVAIYFDTGNKNYLKVNLYTTDKITEPVVNPPIDEVDEDFLIENRIINRMINDKPVEPKILIGIEHYYDLSDEEKDHIILPSGLRAVRTKLRANEWIIFGKQKYTNNNVFIIKTDEEIINSLTELEGIGILEKDESADEIIEFFKKTVKIAESGEISVAWPWKGGKRKELDSNKSLAFSRFMNFLNAVKTQEVWKEIVKQMQEQEESGIIEETPEQNVDNVEYYIPYQIIRKDDSNMTKVRIVFDASSHLIGKISLNASVH